MGPKLNGDRGSELDSVRPTPDGLRICVPIVTHVHGNAVQVVIVFDVDKHGTLGNIEIGGKAETDALNQPVISALRASSPTAPLPAAYPRDRVRIAATFDYNPIQQLPQ